MSQIGIVLVLGLAVALGCFIALFFKPQSNATVKWLLAFSGAFLLSTVAHEMLPDIYDGASKEVGTFLLLGVFIQIILEFFSKGAEHGHVHTHQHEGHKSFPIALFLSLCIHAFLEGMPLMDSNNMVYGIAVHKLPIAYVFTAFLLQSGLSKIKTVVYVFIFGSMSPLGSILMEYLTVAPTVMLALKALVTGIILHVSTTLILESSEGHTFNLKKILVMLLGAVLGFLV